MTRTRLLAAVVIALVAVTAGPELAPRATAAGTEGLELPAQLSTTGLFAGGRIDEIAAGVRAFAPQYPLWTDGAAKRRWVRLPAGSAIDGSDEGAWRFPVGTRFWKEFSFNGRRVETRLLWKASDAGWVAASYAWNDAGTDATLVPEDGVSGAVEIAGGRWHSIPSRTECAACHGPRREPLGFNALQLSTDRDPGALHGEPLKDGMVTLQTLVAERLLASARRDLLERPPRIATADPGTRTALGYLSANCGSCHDGSAAISARVPSLRFADLLRDGDAAARGLVGVATRWQAPGRPDGTTVLVDPASPAASAMVMRMSSRRPSTQMPPLGTVVRDQEAVDAMTRWIATLPRRLSVPEPDSD